MGKDNVPQGSVSGWDWFPTVFLCLFGLIWFVVGRKILLPTVLNLWTWTHSKVALGLSLTGSSAVDSPQPLPTTPSKPNPCQRCVRATMEHRAKPREYQKAFPEQGVKPRFLEETPWHFSHEHRMESWDGIYFFLLWMQSWVAGLGEVNPGHPSTEVGVHISAYLSWKRKPPEKSLQSQSPADPTL